MELRVRNLPDAGEFAEGRLCWDILNAAGRCSTCSKVDLSVATFLRPYSLACICALGALSERRAQLVLPQDQRCRDHIVRLGLHEWFECPIVPRVSGRGTNIVLEQLSDRPGMFATKAMELLFEGLPVSAGLRPELENHLDEIVLNALTHADSPVGCITVGQAFPEKQWIELAILDLGRTIRGHLRQNPAHKNLRDDREAILLATQEGVTGTVGRNRWGEPNSGVGLSELRTYCEQGMAEVAILSGGHCVVLPPGREQNSPITIRLRQGFRGTLVHIRFLTGDRLLPGVPPGIIW